MGVFQGRFLGEHGRKPARSPKPRERQELTDVGDVAKPSDHDKRSANKGRFQTSSCPHGGDRGGDRGGDTRLRRILLEEGSSFLQKTPPY